MKPIWARKFEPPGISGDESQEVIETLMKISAATSDRKYLEPIPAALSYLRRSRLEDGRLARYYELQTNKPLYMVRRGKQYELTYDDSSLPAHYGWKFASRLDEIETAYRKLRAGTPQAAAPSATADLVAQARQIVDDLDDQGRWISRYEGERLVGQPKIPLGSEYLSSDVFSRNLTTLSEFLIATSSDKEPGQSGLRKWTDRSGRFSVEAELIGVSDGNVRLRRSNGQVITVPINKLSERDQRHLESLPPLEP
jgi:hypothetical protein